jgi:hypothetical protein
MTGTLPVATVDATLFNLSFAALWRQGPFFPDNIERDRWHLARAIRPTGTPVRVLRAVYASAPRTVRRTPRSRGITGWVRRGGRRPL